MADPKVNGGRIVVKNIVHRYEAVRALNGV